jgi:hypothetical protein
LYTASRGDATKNHLKMQLPLISKKSLALAFVCLIALLSASTAWLYARLRSDRATARAASASRLAGFPKLFLWAWERPEQLEFIDTREVGVAFLSRAIYLREDRVIGRPRMQPLKIPQSTTLMAVVRIETVRDAPPTLSPAQRRETVDALVEVASAKNVSALQIDFDALESERSFYKDLLRDLRPRLPKEMPLSITALASWCIYDSWLDDLPVDEAVPMLFRMGVDEERVRSYLKAGGQFRSRLCRASSGVSTDEALNQVYTRERTYVFNPRPWTEGALRGLLERNRNEKTSP